MTMTNGPRPFEVWRMSYRYEDDPGTIKHRPVVVVEISDNSAVAVALKVTGHGPRPEYPGEIRLMGWKEAGLDKPSTVRCSKAASFPIELFAGARRYGSLTERDEIAVREGLEECRRFGM